MYLEPSTGDVGIYNILKMAREGLRLELITALHKSVISKEIVHSMGLRVKTNGDFTTVNLTIRPMATGPAATLEAPLYLVLMEEAPKLSIEQAQHVPTCMPITGVDSHGADADACIASLKQELRAKEEYLQTFNEEQETSNEELKSANEEMQSVNEELQSTNEELETAKEEMQSVNEELATVNGELQTKVMDLSRANNDMNNLLAGTGVATVFVDHKLRILRFTPTATQIINLIPGDAGRPLGHIVSNLTGYERLLEDTQAVLNTLVPKEVEVEVKTSGWHLLRIQPYRTLENMIEGAVITFVNITELKRMRDVVRESEAKARLAVVVHDANDAIIMQDMNGNILAWNPAAEKMYGWSEAEALKMNISALVTEKSREKSLATVQQLSRAEVLEPARIERCTKEGRILEVQVTATALVNDTGQVYAIATTERGKYA
jgi:two-component system CheB/CheR fusion protein